MDTLLEKFSRSMNEFKFDHRAVSVFSSQSRVNGFNHQVTNRPSLPTNFQPNNLSPSSTASSASSEGDSSEEKDHSRSNAVLKYISEILMEEDLGGKTCMLQDCMALQAAERSFYDALGAKYPPSPNKPHPSVHQNANSPDDFFTPNSSNCSSTTNNLLELNWVRDLGDFESSNVQTPFVDGDFISTLLSDSQSSSQSSNSQSSTVDGLGDSPVSILRAPDLFGEARLMTNQFGGGIGEATKIPPNANFVIGDLELEEKTQGKAAKGKMHKSPDGSNGRKNHHREDGDSLEEGRRNKHSAVYTEVSDQFEMFDKVLLCSANDSKPCIHVDESSRSLQHQNGQSKGSNGRTTRGKKQGNKREMVDFSTLLTQCAQAVANSDHKTANEFLKQIRQHSSPSGDGSQRLAHYFANGLEARLDGSRTQFYTVLSTRASAADVLKAYHLYVSVCPFKKMSNMYANKTIGKLAAKATRLHIIDFGIAYGFQWPCLIQGLSERPGGPPKLRITGIDLPQPGFRPAERVEETGQRLAKYCERFNVPFEYIAIAQKWETIRYEDLKIDRDEVLVVNSLYRMRNLLDETVVVSSPRDAVLKLIKRINPDLFIHGVVNGTYNAPFFGTRFRETLFHFSGLFDMFDATVPRDNEERTMFEKEIFGRDSMNIIACEGSQRVDRPETYKQWQVRNMRAGLRQLPLDREILTKVKSIVKKGYHKDFVVDENGQWMLQGWKGRILYALSYWKAAN